MAYYYYYLGAFNKLWPVIDIAREAAFMTSNQTRFICHCSSEDCKYEIA